MNRLDRLVISAKNRATVIKNSLMEKEFGDSQVVVALILIVVAIGLCFVFRNQVNNIIQGVANKVNTAINALSSGAVDNQVLVGPAPQ